MKSDASNSNDAEMTGPLTYQTSVAQVWDAWNKEREGTDLAVKDVDSCLDMLGWRHL